MTKEDILELIKNDSQMMKILETVKTLNLPDWYIGAGFIRSKVWDTLHNYSKPTPIPDIDVIYLKNGDFSPEEISKDTTKVEIEYENKLKKLMPSVNWSVTNQARMHVFHDDPPYVSSQEALSKWVETATCVGVKIDDNHQLVLSAPRGIKDLVNLILRPTSTSPQAIATFHERIKNKDWLKKWPKLTIKT